jgi:hypothetical protein
MSKRAHLSRIQRHWLANDAADPSKLNLADVITLPVVLHRSILQQECWWPGLLQLLQVSQDAHQIPEGVGAPASEALATAR